MTPLRLDHTAIAVADLGEAIPRYCRLYGLQAGPRLTVPEQQVEVSFLTAGDTQLELISPTTADSGVARFLTSRGEALHHIAFLVADIRAELDQLAAEGIRLIDREPRPGAHGLVAFLHPRGTGGVLVELVQAEEGGGG